MTRSYNLSQSVLDQITTHLVLPRYLRDTSSEYEMVLIKLMVDTLGFIKNDHYHSPIPATTIKLFNNFEKMHPLTDANLISKELKNIQPGEMLGMYVQKQNCGLMVYKLPNQLSTSMWSQNLICSTFPAKLNSSGIGDRDTDLQFEYPSQSLKVTSSKMLESIDFANQLCTLYHTGFENPTNTHVSKWLVPTLADRHSVMATESEFPRFTKKVRDEVLESFERSAYWTVIKVLLQSNLIIELGMARGRFLYKLILLGFLTKVSNFYNDDRGYSFINVELVDQLIAKMARRIEKIEKKFDSQKNERSFESLFDEFSSLVDLILSDAKAVIAKLRSKIDLQIRKLEIADEHNSMLKPLPNLHFDDGVIQRIPKLSRYLQGRKFKDELSEYDGSIRYTKFMRHYMNREDLPNINCLTNDSLTLMDYENWILYELKYHNGTKIDSTELRRWSLQYASIADPFYAGDPIGNSRMLLTRFKILVILDLIATRKYPLLLEHRSGINSAVFDNLILPHHIDMKICNGIQNYYRQRNSQAAGPALIEEDKPQRKSFPVRFAKIHSQMLEIHGKIQLLANQEIEEKRAEWVKKRLQVAEMRLRESKMTCTYYSSSYFGLMHSGSCSKCALNIAIRRIEMKVYERPLPTSEHEQYAVVFELAIPTEIACLRDVLYASAKILNQSTNSDNFFRKWIEYERISSYNLSNCVHVSMGSTSMLTLSRQYQKLSLHVDDSFDSFVVENGYNCCYHAADYSLPTNINNQSVKELCTFSVEPSSPYSNLQWTVTSTYHTQNQVISKQSTCSTLLSLAEYKNFGSLRADGHRLQLRKLYATIETETLSFETSSVLSLIMQTIWETGPGGNGLYNRESHEDFIDPIFAMEMVRLLEKFIDQQKSNWKDPKKLLMATLVIVRIFDLNPVEAVVNRIIQVLRKIRTIIVDWMDKVQTAIHESNNQRDEVLLRPILVSIVFAGTATFFIHSKHAFFPRIFADNSNNEYSAVRVWLELIVTMNNNNMLISSDQTSLDRIFTRFVRSIGIHLEATMRKMIENNSNEIEEFVKSKWFMAKDGTFLTQYFCSNHPQTLVVQVFVGCVVNNVIIDTITGEFTVNNLPVAKLPSSITGTCLFQRIFKNFIFEVQPEKQNFFSTVHNYLDCSYNFKINDNGIIVITERRKDAIKCELIPPDVFSNEIPYLLIKEHSHWWNKSKNVIEFRPNNFMNGQFSLPSKIVYELDLNTRRLLHLKTKRLLLDITSFSYTEIIKRLSRLECEEYIHILISPDAPGIASVELQRMQLKFQIDTRKQRDKYDIVSNEFMGMRVSLKQKCGTLFGLNHGLLLEGYLDSSKFTPKRLLIMPHGHMNVSKCGHHVNVNIDNGLRSPPFHTYEIDDFCRQLKASSCNYSAWFYLAYLHALTSHGEPEPFTGLSGTERALQIFQSAFAWSPAPFENEANDTLTKFAALSPERSYRNEVKFVRWPQEVHPHAANDSYIFIAMKLLKDSQRLRGLYKTTFGFGGKGIEDKTQLKLNKRDYLRQLTLSPNCRVTNEFILFQKSSTTRALFEEPEPYIKHTRMVSTLHHGREYHVFNDFNLTEFLIYGSSELDGPVHIVDAEEILSHALKTCFRNFWISLYEIARRRLFDHEKFALICSLFAYQGQPIDAILALQAVEANASSFDSIEPPNIGGYNLVYLDFSSDVIVGIFKGHHNYPSNYDTYTSEMESDYSNQLTNDILRLTTAISRMWPCDEVNSTIHNYSAKNINISGAVVEINKFLLSWNNNRKLKIFINDIQMILDSLRSRNGDITHFKPWNINKSIQPEWKKYEIDFEAKLSEDLNQYGTVLLKAQAVYVRNNVNASRLTSHQWFDEFLKIARSQSAKHLIDAQMYPRLVITSVLQKLLHSTDYRLKWLIGAFAVTLALEQRRQRIATFELLPQMIVALEREKENELHSNWLPFEHPEWLLFEIEQNLGIRRIQIEIAKRMINPPAIGSQHSVMQLNMGEGKTAVIVPILASVLSDSKTVCQITVLKSLYATNLKSLRQCLGGMLNRRVYTFPCRRDMPIGGCVADMLTMYEECKRSKGVILTLPEYRLSFQLKIYESVCKGEFEHADRFLAAHKWINENVRSILDESDAILNAKYQLIYTVGDQMALDGGSMRWTLIQALFKRIPYHMKMLYRKYGSEKIEFDENYLENSRLYGANAVSYRPDVFTPCRILDEKIYCELKEALVSDFVNGKTNITFTEIVKQSEKQLIRLLSDKNIDKESFEKLIAKFPEGSHVMLLIVSGLLRFEVLRLVMTKRWRVNYGVNQKSVRKMAVPYKAKDIAAEMTEFGHPDVALGFTHLSYYYSGLSDEQLYHVFKILSTNQNPVEIYEQWIRSVPTELVDVSIRSYTGVNLKNPKQRDEHLFPLLRFNMHVIDYWLSNAVFPREAKTFEKKLTCTAWDLTSEHMQNTVSGFSGTNDTKNLLPSTISQNDLAELEQTNTNVRLTLLRTENQSYESLPPNVSGKFILKKLAKCAIPVLLDSGALMLELNNKEVACEWLKLVPPKSFDAAIYFNMNDVMMTIDRNDIEAEFDCSVYREKLNRCLVYLDDVHTRGTDLKFPLKWRACVTLSGDITRDKTVRACMRMRLLGKGHSIAFWASYEAGIRIREICNLGIDQRPSNENVIKFISYNSDYFEKENTVHWAAAGYNYTKKLSAHKLHENSGTKNALVQLNAKCLDNEYITLNEMYGGKDDVLLTKISATKFIQLSNTHVDDPTIDRFIVKMKQVVDSKIRTHIPNMKRFTGSLDEEQEKELEHELEEQREVERPRSATPAIPFVDPLFIKLVRYGGMHRSFQQLLQSESLVKLPLSLINTNIFQMVQNELSAWSDHLYVTKDFVRVINETLFKWDMYLRPVWWITCVRRDSEPDLIIVFSSFECNALLPYFRISKNAVFYMFRPRVSLFQSNLLNNKQLQITAAINDRPFDVHDEVQISMIAGSMYFGSEREQDAYCSFMGLIPRQRTMVHQQAYERGLIKPNGFVPIENRQLPDVVDAVGQCKFRTNPVIMATRIVEACHEFLRKNSHVSTIVNGKKQINNFEN